MDGSGKKNWILRLLIEEAYDGIVDSERSKELNELLQKDFQLRKYFLEYNYLRSGLSELLD